MLDCCLHTLTHSTFLLTMQSLAGVDDTITRMRVKIKTLDSDIRGIVREQAETGHDGRQVCVNKY